MKIGAEIKTQNLKLPYNGLTGKIAGIQLDHDDREIFLIKLDKPFIIKGEKDSLKPLVKYLSLAEHNILIK